MSAGAILPYTGMLLALAASGLASGFIAGLFGVGGGIVTAPVLYFVLRAAGASEDVSLKTAIGTSLAVIIVTSLRSLAAHARSGRVDYTLLRRWTPWIALGAAAGGLMSGRVPGEALAVVFAVGALGISVRTLARRKPAPGPQGEGRSSPSVYIPIGVASGFFSALMGLGGGAVGAMLMRAAGRSAHQAIATASGFGVAVAVPGAAGFVWSGWSAAGLPAGSLGYVSAPAFVVLAIGAGLAAPWGAMLAHRLEGAAIERFFALYVAATALALAADMLL